MNFITIFTDFIYNFGIFAAIYAFYSLIADLVKLQREEMRQIQFGALFGIMSCVAMASPFPSASDILIDSRHIVIALPGIFFGTLSAFVSIIPPMITAALSGSPYIGLKIITLLASALGGAAFGSYMRSAQQTVTFVHIIIFSFIFSLIHFVTYLSHQETGIGLPSAQNIMAGIKDIGLPLLASHLLGMIVLSSLLLFDMRRRQTMDDMKLRERQAFQAAQSKSEFLALMSHEIRTPLNGIIGFAEVMDKTNLDTNQKHFNDQILIAGKVLLRILNDILDLSKIEAGRMTLSMEEFSLKDLVRSVFELMRMDGENRGNTMILDISPHVPDVIILDSYRLRQILYNLLNNAVKFTRDGRITLKVNISTHQNGNQLVLKVIDTGIGIALEKQSLIFDSFVQEDASVTRKYGGTGLGLSIVKRLVELMNGQIQLESALNRGTTFTVSIPYRAGTIQPHSDTATSPHHAALHIKQLPHILVVDDTAMNITLIKAILSNKSYYIHTADNAHAAIDIIKNSPIDLVLMDIRMPTMSGPEATQYIRHELNIPHHILPIIALTAHNGPEELKACYESGMDDVITKPIDSYVLCQKIDEWLNKNSNKVLSVQKHNDDSALFLQPDIIQQYSHFLGPQKLKSTFDDFMISFSNSMTTIQNSGYNPQVINDTLHAIKSVAGSLGLRRLYTECDAIILSAEKLDHAQREQKISHLKNLADESAIAFEIYLQQAST